MKLPANLSTCTGTGWAVTQSWVSLYQLIPAPCLINPPNLILSVGKETDISVASWIVFAHNRTIPAMSKNVKTTIEQGGTVFCGSVYGQVEIYKMTKYSAIPIDVRDMHICTWTRFSTCQGEGILRRHCEKICTDPSKDKPASFCHPNFSLLGTSCSHNSTAEGLAALHARLDEEMGKNSSGAWISYSKVPPAENLVVIPTYSVDLENFQTTLQAAEKGFFAAMNHMICLPETFFLLSIYFASG